jgi:hypothetical protein
MIAAATDPAMSEEIARRLNKSDWSDQEDQWALRPEPEALESARKPNAQPR